jgi:NADPH:quinone reductase and related Zn-dependent oxidoreductases
MSNNLSLAITEFGAPEVLTPVNRPIPSPSEEQVLIQVKAAGVNPIDAKTRAGLGWAAEHNRDHLPWVPGYDVAGVVVANGTNESKFDVGDRVAGMIGFPHRRRGIQPICGRRCWLVVNRAADVCLWWMPPQCHWQG